MRKTVLLIISVAVFFVTIALADNSECKKPTFNKKFISLEYGNSRLDLRNRFRVDCFYSKNATMLSNRNCPNNQVVIPGRFTLDTVFSYKYRNEECNWDSIIGKAGARFKGTFGVDGSGFYTGLTHLNDLGVVGNTHSHPINVHIPVLRECWLKIVLDDMLGIGCCKNHALTFGMFPFQLGRGIALGDAYGVSPDFIGYDTVSAIDQYAPGFKLSGELCDDHALDYDFYGAILGNKSGSFYEVNRAIQQQMYGKRFDPARGFGAVNYLIAGRLKFLPVNEDDRKLYIESYALFNDEREQRIEFMADASSRLGTFGLCVEMKAGKWEFSFDTAHNVGTQKVKGLDRNIITRRLRNGFPTFVNSEVKDIFGDLVVYDPGSNEQNAIEKLIQDSCQCDSLKSENGELIDGTTCFNATDRFRDPYENKLMGSMFVFDAIYNFCDDLKIAGSLGFATGDENPNKDLNELNESSVDGNYKGFIGLQEIYTGNSVRSAFMFGSNGRIPRYLSFPVTRHFLDNDKVPVDISPSSTSRFTNIIFGGCSAWFDLYDCDRLWSFNPNILAFWEHKRSKIFSRKAGKFLSEYLARRYFGTEANLYFNAHLMPGLKFFIITGIFVPGGYYSDVKGVPPSRVALKYLDSLDKTGETAERVPLLGDNMAFFFNAGFEFLF